MAATKIMVIRHAERPPDDGSIDGVSQSGAKDPKDLIVRGWQRAGALVRFFAPADGHFVNGQLATPDTIFASKVAHHSPSLRPQHTVMLLADFLHKSKGPPPARAQARGRLVPASSASAGARAMGWTQAEAAGAFWVFRCHRKLPGASQLLAPCHRRLAEVVEPALATGMDIEGEDEAAA